MFLLGGEDVKNKSRKSSDDIWHHLHQLRRQKSAASPNFNFAQYSVVFNVITVKY